MNVYIEHRFTCSLVSLSDKIECTEIIIIIVVSLLFKWLKLCKAWRFYPVIVLIKISRLLT